MLLERRVDRSVDAAIDRLQPKRSARRCTAGFRSLGVSVVELGFNQSRDDAREEADEVCLGPAELVEGNIVN